jgi:hypothetical protein
VNPPIRIGMDTAKSVFSSTALMRTRWWLSVAKSDEPR